MGCIFYEQTEFLQIWSPFQEIHSMLAIIKLVLINAQAAHRSSGAGWAFPSSWLLGEMRLYKLTTPIHSVTSSEAGSEYLFTQGSSNFAFVIILQELLSSFSSLSHGRPKIVNTIAVEPLMEDS